MRKAFLAAGFLAAVLASSGCTLIHDTRYYEPAKLLGPSIAPPGSEWSNVRRDSGSYGSGVSHVTSKSLPMQNWQGRPHFAHEAPEGTTLIEPTTGRWVAQLKDGKPVVSWDPSIGYHWPMWVGESWSTPYRVTNHATGKTVDMRAQWVVEAEETVHVPAGSFRTFRVRYSSPSLRAVAWFSPDLGISVKSRFERIGENAGVRESELLRHNIKR